MVANKKVFGCPYHGGPVWNTQKISLGDATCMWSSDMNTVSKGRQELFVQTEMKSQDTAYVPLQIGRKPRMAFSVVV